MEQSKREQTRNQNLTITEGRGALVSSIQKIEKLKKPSKTRNPAAFRKPKRRFENPPGFQRQNMNVSWRPMSPRDNAGNHLHSKIMRITFLVHGCFRIRNFHCSRHGNKFVSQVLITCRIVSFACNERNSKRFQSGSWTKKRAKRSCCVKCTETKRKSTLPHWWTALISRKRSWNWTFRNIKVGVVFRACAVFTAQAASVSQLTAAKVDVIARRPHGDGQAANAVSAYTQVKMEDAPRLLRIPLSQSPDLWKRLPRHKWSKSWSNIEVLIERNFYGHPFAGELWERWFEEVLMEFGWERVPNWVCLLVHRKQGFFFMWMSLKKAGKQQKMEPEKCSWRAHFIFLLTYVWDAHNVNANRTKLLLSTEQCLNHVFLLEDLKITSVVKTSFTIWTDMLQKRFERYGELAKKDRAPQQNSKSLLE